MGHPLSHLTNHTARSHPPGVYAVCSANQRVIQTAWNMARSTGSFLLLEATANQVNLSGGYAHLTPEAYAGRIRRMAQKTGLSDNQYMIGMDHLGPHAWPQLSTEKAFQNAAGLVQACVKAGFQKIHFDTISGTSLDPNNPAELEKAAQQTAALCQVAETAFRQYTPQHSLVYVIGADVPPPGGGLEADAAAPVTDPGHLARTLDAFQAAFWANDLQRAWEKITAIVVQPGVDFGDYQVADYDPQRAAPLAVYRQHLPQGMTYEVHAADYQKPGALKQMVRDGFNLLKIGPCLTFTLRRTLYDLSHIEDALPDLENPSYLRQILEAIMVDQPIHWESRYKGSPEQLAYLRHFSLRDRIRYYWSTPPVHRAVEQLLRNLNRQLPRALAEQYLPDIPDHTDTVDKTAITHDPEAIIAFRLRQALKPYHDACNGGKAGQSEDRPIL